MPDTKKIQIIHAALAEIGKKRGFKVEKEEKESLVRQFSKGREISTKGLRNTEADALILHLNSLTDGSPQSVMLKKGEQMRRHIIAMAHEMGWQKPDGKIDIERINNWCLGYGVEKKKLNDYKYEELPSLVSQFKKVYQSYLRAISKPTNR